MTCPTVKTNIIDQFKFFYQPFPLCQGSESLSTIHLRMLDILVSVRRLPDGGIQPHIGGHWLPWQWLELIKKHIRFTWLTQFDMYMWDECKSTYISPPSAVSGLLQQSTGKEEQMLEDKENKPVSDSLPVCVVRTVQPSPPSEPSTQRVQTPAKAKSPSFYCEINDKWMKPSHVSGFTCLSFRNQ